MTLTKIMKDEEGEGLNFGLRFPFTYECATTIKGEESLNVTSLRDSSPSPHDVLR